MTTTTPPSTFPLKRPISDHPDTPSKRPRRSSTPLTPPFSQPNTPPPTLPNTPTTYSNDGRPKNYRCADFPPCTQTFTRPCRLEEHIRSHTGSRPFVCTIDPEKCQKTFVRDYHLSRHIKHAHASENSVARPFICTFDPHASEAGGQPMEDDGIMTEQVDASHVADTGSMCGKAFATRQRLTMHEKTHRDKPRCEEMVSDGAGGLRRCAAVFRKAGTLRAHVEKVHRGQHPFVCDVEVGAEKSLCGAGYDTRGKLNEHVRRCHSGARYVCGICISSGSNDQDIMDVHDEPQSANGLAHGPFSSLAELAAHNRRFHPPTKTSQRGRPQTLHPSNPPKQKKGKKKANQHTARLAQQALFPAADLLTGPIHTHPSSFLNPDTNTPTSLDHQLDNGIPCLRSHCLRFFSTEFLLGEHCSDAHGMAEVEIAEALRERAALAGGVFWLGGLGADDDDFDEDEDFDGSWAFDGGSGVMFGGDVPVDPELLVRQDEQMRLATLAGLADLEIDEVMQ